MQRSSTPTRPSQARDAIDQLTADHALLQSLFDEYDTTHAPSRKEALIAQICTELVVHMQIEEEILYPEVISLTKHPLLVPEATVEHAGIKDLIVQLEAADAVTPQVDEQVKALARQVRHHVLEEHTSMFPLVKASSMDTRALGLRMSARRRELLSLPA